MAIVAKNGDPRAPVRSSVRADLLGVGRVGDLDQGGGVLTRQEMPAPLAPVPAGLPSDLLERRPDLRAAEMRKGEAEDALAEAELVRAGAQGKGTLTTVDVELPRKEFDELAHLRPRLLGQTAHRSTPPITGSIPATATMMSATWPPSARSAAA